VLSNNLRHTLATVLIPVCTGPHRLVENLCTATRPDATGRRWRILSDTHVRPRCLLIRKHMRSVACSLTYASTAGLLRDESHVLLDLVCSTTNRVAVLVPLRLATGNHAADQEQPFRWCGRTCRRSGATGRSRGLRRAALVCRNRCWGTAADSTHVGQPADHACRRDASGK